MFKNDDGFFDRVPDLEGKALKGRMASNINAAERVQQRLLAEQKKLAK